LGREVLDEAFKAVAVGVTTDEIDRIVHEACVDRDCYPSPLNYYQVKSYNLNYDFFQNFLSFTYLCNKSDNLNKRVVGEAEKFKVAVNNLVSWKTSFV
jgi:hypothetical protein